MRFMIKLALMIAMFVGMQALIQRNEQELDEAMFEGRCLVGKLCGRENNDVELMDAAMALRSRQVKRFERYAAATAATAARSATTRPAEVRAASVADELEWSFACSTGDTSR
jgi:hypothetical protein